MHLHRFVENIFLAQDRESVNKFQFLFTRFVLIKQVYKKHESQTRQKLGTFKKLKQAELQKLSLTKAVFLLTVASSGLLLLVEISRNNFIDRNVIVYSIYSGSHVLSVP